MWVMTLSIITLALMLAVLMYFIFFARRLQASLDSLQNEQGERLRRIERDLDRVRHALDSISTGVMTLDIRQRINKG